MKKKFLYVFLIVFSVILLVCSRSYSSPILGVYTFDKVVYFPPFSSSSLDYIENRMKDTKCTIHKDIFRIDSSKEHVKLDHPSYEKKKMDKEMIHSLNKATFQLLSLSDYKNCYKYSISNNKKQKANYCLYVMDNELWLASFIKKPSIDSDIMLNIYKLK
ncbi:hypothetical protein [Anaeromicropila herbilytica]|uniref:Uncharacterized protein n=1 Tax=Anaeromicropila herbilytica TaxID=2785025 RepID=A0A7R7IC47_9FIRM|nr:hypothetical protein [Anaeromicropila herbilytica]BCN29481.1 hypothetical protein bsdtb5_07760 [Anaeromicropila herbilytica]